MFRLPTLNLTANVWHNSGVVPPAGAPDIAGMACQLAWDHSGDIATPPAAQKHFMKMRVPPRSDLRDANSSTGPDVVEIPAGTARYYAVQLVDDVGRGFPNEFRQALVTLAAHPTPLP
jgi:hypothetical protein